MRIAIHQPNFFPHLAFFNKMKEVDEFVMLRHCQFEKNNYQNRFNLDGKWYGLGVPKKKQTIFEKKYSLVKNDWAKLKRRLPDYDLDVYDELMQERVQETNILIIAVLASFLDIKNNLVLDRPTNYTGTQRLINICKERGADEYLSGPSGAAYMDMEAFHKAGIKVLIQQPEESIPILKCV